MWYCSNSFLACTPKLLRSTKNSTLRAPANSMRRYRKDTAVNVLPLPVAMWMPLRSSPGTNSSCDFNHSTALCPESEVRF